MAQPAGEAQSDALRLDFEHRLKLEFHGRVFVGFPGPNLTRRLSRERGKRP